MRLKGIWGSIIGGGALGGIWKGALAKLALIRGAVWIEAIRENHISGRVRICIKTPHMSPCEWKKSAMSKPGIWEKTAGAGPRIWAQSSASTPKEWSASGVSTPNSWDKPEPPEPQQWEPPQVCSFK